MAERPDIGLGKDFTGGITVEVQGVNSRAILEELGQFALTSPHIQGVVVETNAPVENRAFTGGDKGAFFATMSTLLVRWDTPEAIREATMLTVSDERLAEIADFYSLPDYLRRPDNAIDASVAYIIKKMAGISDDPKQTLKDEATESTTSLLLTPGITPEQGAVFALNGELNSMHAQQNSAYRAIQLETLDHVLRFMIMRDLRRSYGNGDVYMSTDYDWATGALGDALDIVNGSSTLHGYLDDTDPRLTRGMLQQKLSIVIKDGVVSVGSQNSSSSTPIWPQSAVVAHQAEQTRLVLERADKAARIRADMDAAREAQAAVKEAETIAWENNLRTTLNVISESNYEWVGIMPTTGPLGDPQKLNDYLNEAYPDCEFILLHETSVYGLPSMAPQQTDGRVTVFKRPKS